MPRLTSATFNLRYSGARIQKTARFLWVVFSLRYWVPGFEETARFTSAVYGFRKLGC